MKKLIIAAVSVATAVATNAATITWNSGTAKMASDATGAFGSKTFASTSGNQTFNVSIWYLSSEDFLDYAAVSGTKAVNINKDKIYADAKSGQLGTISENEFTFNNYQVAQTKNVATAAYTDSSRSYASEKIYAVVLCEYTDAQYGDMYIANAAIATVAAQNVTVANLATKEGGPTGSTISSWTPVPEPTSGLLMLLGMAGLALKRKRA